MLYKDPLDARTSLIYVVQFSRVSETVFVMNSAGMRFFFFSNLAQFKITWVPQYIFQVLPKKKLNKEEENVDRSFGF